MILTRENELKAIIDKDNHEMKVLFNNSRFLRDNFQTRLVGKRLVAWGKFDNGLIMIKKKQGKL